jgi:hypothetical protein
MDKAQHTQSDMHITQMPLNPTEHRSDHKPLLGPVTHMIHSEQGRVRRELRNTCGTTCSAANKNTEHQ